MLPPERRHPRRRRRRVGARLFGIVAILLAGIPWVMQLAGRRPVELPPVSPWPLLAALVGMLVAWRRERLGGALLLAAGAVWGVLVTQRPVPAEPIGYAGPVLLGLAGLLFLLTPRTPGPAV